MLWTIQPTRFLLSMEFSRQEYWSGLPFPSPGHLLDPRIKPSFPTLAGEFFAAEPPGKTHQSVQSLSRVPPFATPWTAARQASLSITNSRSLLKLMSIELVMPSNYLILCRPLLLLPSILPSIRVFSSEPVLQIMWQIHIQYKVLEFQIQHQSFQWIFRTDFL